MSTRTGSISSHGAFLRRSSSKGAFTLTELLVVIAIIMMLTALVMASLSRAREAGRRTKCASNMHQLSLMVLMYAQENGGFTPSLAYNGGSGGYPYPVSAVGVAAANGGGNGGGNGGNGGGNSGGGNGFPNCTPDTNNMVYICHVPPGDPTGLSTEYVGWTATGPQGHQNHINDHCGPCSGYIGAYWNGQWESLYNGYLPSALGSRAVFNLAACPSDMTPEYLWVIDEAGIAHYYPASYNENLEFVMTRGRLETLRKPACTIFLYDGRPSNLIGEYSITKYAVRDLPSPASCECSVRGWSRGIGAEDSRSGDSPPALRSRTPAPTRKM